MSRGAETDDTTKLLFVTRKADLSDMWGDEKLSDVVVQLVVPKETGGGGGEEASLSETNMTAMGKTSTENVVVMETMKLHGAVLAPRSPYFLRALTSGFRESTDKTIVLRLEDEDAVEDMKLLLRLTYTSSYTQIGGGPFDKPQLLRLLRLADGFEMTDCMAECAVALRPMADYDEALHIFQTIPDSVLGHDGLASLLKEGGDIIASALPSVDTLWTPGVNSSKHCEA